jgi:hypothetical protein
MIALLRASPTRATAKARLGAHGGSRSSLASPIADGASCCWPRPPPWSPPCSPGEPLLAHWTQTFMTGTVGFVAQFFPIFLLGALFGKLMEDSGSVQSVARFMGERLGARGPSWRWCSPAPW